MKYLAYILSILPIQDQLDLIGLYQINEVIYEYGSYKDDAYLIAYALSNDEVYFEWTYDLGFQEQVIYLADLGQGLVACIVKIDIDEERLYQLIVLEDGLIKKEIPLDIEVKDVYNHHHYLIIDDGNEYLYFNDELSFVNEIEVNEDVYRGVEIQYQGQAYINNQLVDEIVIDDFGYHQIKIIDGDYLFETSIKFKTKTPLIGQGDNHTFLGQVVIDSPGLLYLDGERIDNGYRINELGQHYLQIYDGETLIQDQVFHIKAKVLYEMGEHFLLLENDLTFHEPVRIFSSGGEIIINNQVYSGQWIHELGSYDLQVQFNDKVLENYQFKIESTVEGLVDGASYESVIIYAFGDVYLNDLPISGFVEVDKPGKYQVVVAKENEKEVIAFVIEGKVASRNFNYGYLILSISFVGLLIKIVKKVR
jgi:hypothetical protein